MTLPIYYMPIKSRYCRVNFKHLQVLINLPKHHNDPFDRLIIAQSIAENMVILTKDDKFSLYATDVNWE